MCRRSFCAHRVGRFLLPLIANHDREQFEVFCYADVRVPDLLTARLQSHAGNWRDILGSSTRKWPDAARRWDRCPGRSDAAHEQQPAAALRPKAAVQVSYLAYCSTTGLDTMDYRFTDPHLDSVEWQGGCYSEKSAPLPRTYWCYQPHIDCPDVAPLPARDGRITFGCLNNFCKVSPGTLDTWRKLLAEIPQSRCCYTRIREAIGNMFWTFSHSHALNPTGSNLSGAGP